MNEESQLRVQKLVQSGLPEKESRVYMATLEMGRGTVTQIARRSGVSRTNTYNVLDSLTEKHLVRVSGKEPKEEYAAEPPTKIVEYFRGLHESAAQHYSEVEKLLPELTAMHKIEDRPQIKFYEGIEGLKQVYEDTLTSSEKIVAYAKYEEMFEALGNYFPLYYKRRAQKGIPIMAIIPKTPMALEQSTHDKEVARETAFVPPGEYSFSPEINVYDNKVMIASWKEKLGIIIESEEIADAMKKIFRLAWAEAKRLDASSKSTPSRHATPPRSS